MHVLTTKTHSAVVAAQQSLALAEHPAQRTPNKLDEREPYGAPFFESTMMF
jgi:hypothetical protein